MENASLPRDVWNDVTTSLSTDHDLSQYLSHIRYVALKVVYIVIGTVGIVDNLFVVVVFALFIKITDKVFICIRLFYLLIWNSYSSAHSKTLFFTKYIHKFSNKINRFAAQH